MQDAEAPVVRRPSWTDALRRWAPRAAFESLLIVFSVFLALWLSQWADDRRTARRVDDIRGFLAEEMRTNRASVLNPYHLPHHDGLKRDFNAAAGRQADPVDREATRAAMQNLMATGLHPLQLKDAVWTSVSGGELIEHMAPEEVFALAEVYKAQSELEDWGGRGADTVVMLLDILQQPETAKNRLTRMVIYMEDLTSQERRLVGLYDQAIAQLEPDAAATTEPVTPTAEKR